MAEDGKLTIQAIDILSLVFTLAALATGIMTRY